MAIQVMATGIDQKKDELNQVSDNINDAKHELNIVGKEKKDVNEQINLIENDLNKKQKELNDIEAQQAKTQTELENTKQELTTVENSLVQTQDELETFKLELETAIAEANQQEILNADRLRAMYMNSDSSYLELLLESKSLNDLLNRADMITKMIAYDQQVFDGMKLYQDEVEDKKAACEEQEQKIQQYKKDVEDKKVTLENKEREIIDAKEKIAQQKNAIESAQGEKEILLSKLTKEEKAIRNELDELAKQSKELETKIQQLIKEQEGKNDKLNYSGGVMAWPAPGFNRITSPYGRRIHPITKDYRMHTGIDISGYGINGTPAIAAADGVVIMAQRYGGYGNAVIIDHGSGITTLYAHGSSIKVRVGQKVTKGTTVLAIGSTGNSTGPHLHFEIRKNGAPTDPMPYLRK